MKAKFILLASTLLWYFNGQAQSVFDKFEDHNEITTVVVSQKMFQMLSKIDSNDAQAKEFMDIANKLTGLKIFTTSNKSVGQKMADEVKKYLSTASLSELMRVKDKDNNVKFYVKQGKDADHVSELLMFIVDSSTSETVLLTLTGDIDLNKVGTLAGNMNLPEEFKNIKK